MSADFFWCGSYTDTMEGDGSGIGVLLTNEGELDFLGTAAESSSPSFLARKSDMLYATDEGNGVVNAFRVEGNTLNFVGGQPTSGGLPCHLTVCEDWLYCSNYASGSIDVFPIAPMGQLLPSTQTLDASGSGPHSAQDGPHAHSTLVVGDTLFSADLGSDRVYLHSRADGLLTREGSIEFQPGTGPRDLVAIAGRVLVLSELSGELFEIDGDGDGQADGYGIARSCPVVKDRVAGDHGAGLAIDSRGHFAFTALRGSNRVAVIDLRRMEPVFDIGCGGDWPRHVAISGATLYVANQKSGTVASFSIDQETGFLEPVCDPEPVPSPTFLLPGRPLDFVQRESLVK